jgi:SAM-dependent methyltransferase
VPDATAVISTAMSAERPLGEVFDEVAEDYDQVRAGYPTEIVASALDRARLTPGARVLEIGCGTGKLTEVLVGLGLRVDAVDPGARMVAAARRRLGSSEGVAFHIGRFEDIALPLASFYAAFSATAFHWLDARVSWRKVASSLRPGGLLALLTHATLHDERSAEDEAGFRALLRDYAPAVAESHSPPRDLETLLSGAMRRSGNASEVWDWIMGDGRHNLSDAEAARLFEDVDIRAVVSEVERTADELLAHFRTTSLYFQIDPDKRDAFEDDDRRRVEAAGGSLPFSEAVVLMTAQRSSAPVDIPSS